MTLLDGSLSLCVYSLVVNCDDLPVSIIVCTPLCGRSVPNRDFNSLFRSLLPPRLFVRCSSLHSFKWNDVLNLNQLIRRFHINLIIVCSLFTMFDHLFSFHHFICCNCCCCCLFMNWGQQKHIEIITVSFVLAFSAKGPIIASCNILRHSMKGDENLCWVHLWPCMNQITTPKKTENIVAYKIINRQFRWGLHIIIEWYIHT